MAERGRKLEILTNEEAQENNMNYINVPAVLRRISGETGDARNTLAYGLLIEQATADGQVDLTVVKVDGVGSTYRLKSRDEIVIDRDSGKVSFSAYGNKYTIRAIEENDSSWILDDPGQVRPAEELEQMAAMNAQLSSELQW